MAKVILKWRYIKPGTKKHNSNLIDRKLRQKIEEKKQAQGLKMG